MQTTFFAAPETAPRHPASRRATDRLGRRPYEVAYPVRHEESARHPMEEEIERWDGLF
jgi:hypothetical protein